jgi:hypothetical protein
MGIAALLLLPVLSAQTVEEVIAKHIQALGGADKLKTIKTKRFAGKFSGAGGPEFPAKLDQARPEKVRLEFTIQGLTGVQAYDGRVGWAINPFGGKKDAELMGEDQLKSIQEQADFDGSFLVDYKEKGHKIQSMTKDVVEGTDAYKIQLLLKNGTVQTVYLDAEEFLEIKNETRRTVRGTETEQESIVGDYKEVDGIWIPYSFEFGPKNSPSSAKQKFTVEKVALNVPIDESEFTMPKAGAAKPPAPKTEETKNEPKTEKKKK